MTLIGDYNLRGDSALYAVTAHELAHMWIPMIVSSDERRYSWLDEGHTSFHTAEAYNDFFPGANLHEAYRRVYLALAGSDAEVEMMRWSMYVPPETFFVTNYRKPSSVLVALRGLLGDDVFMEAHREFVRRWAWRIPYPWDFFRTVDDVSGQDLWWFWRAWYFETWVLDQAVAAVEPAPDGTRIVVEDRGHVPMPVRLAVTRADGTTERHEIPVTAWLGGANRAELTVPPGAPVVRVEIDAERVFPDVNRGDNVWPR
jgi:aminopeptidase N